VEMIIDQSQHKNKNNNYYNFKTRPVGRPRVRPGSHVKRVKRVDLYQYKIKVIIIIFLKFDLGST